MCHLKILLGSALIVKHIFQIGMVNIVLIYALVDTVPRIVRSYQDDLGKPLDYVDTAA